jgi:MFS family permease
MVDMKAFQGRTHGLAGADYARGAPASRRVLPPRAAYALVAAVVGLALFASGIPSPLYGTYQALWGFPPLVLTLVYATYAGGVLVALIMAGRVSDEIGRRPVLLIALAALMGSAIMFVLADSVAWLFAARAVQGLATGLALGAAGAALLELHPRRDPAAVGLTNGVVSAGGLGLGVLVSSVLVQLLPAPRVLPYVFLFLLFGVAFAGAVWMPESVARARFPRGRLLVCSCRWDRSWPAACFIPLTTWRLVCPCSRFAGRRLLPKWYSGARHRWRARNSARSSSPRERLRS